jgi:hypothetical protein
VFLDDCVSIGIFPMPQLSAQSKLIGQVIHPARDALFAALSVVGLFPRAFDRRRQLAREALAENEAVLVDAHGSLRAGNPDRSLRVLLEWLNSRGDAAEDYTWVATRIADWGDARQINRLYQERIARLLLLKRIDEVLDVMVRRLTVDRQFRPKSAADTLQVAQLAAQAGRLPRLSRALLSDFAARFKGDPRVPVAEALKRHLDALSSAAARQQSA